MELTLAGLAMLVACHHARPSREVAPPRAPATAITLFTDGAFVEQAVEVEVRDRPVVARASLPYDVDPADVIVVERGQLELGVLHAALRADEIAPSTVEEPSLATEDLELDPPPVAIGQRPEPARPLVPPRAFELVVIGPPGHHVVHLAYQTTAMVFAAAYTVTTTAARDRATLRGALSITNLTNLALPDAEIALVDATHEDWRARRREDLLTQLGGPAASATVRVARRTLGTLDLAPGTTRVELLPDAAPRPMKSVLVYDPFGTELDNTTAIPRTEPELGAHATGLVTESFEIERPPHSSDGLPAGPVRVLESRHDGTVAVLGESRMFEAATRASSIDTIPVGTAEGITGRRERVELTVDDDLRRIVEELAIEIVNTRATPVDVVLREHAYRGPTWTLAYHSTPNVTQEGTQQFAMRAHVGANARIRTSHVVVYRW